MSFAGNFWAQYNIPNALVGVVSLISIFALANLLGGGGKRCFVIIQKHPNCARSLIYQTIGFAKQPPCCSEQWSISQQFQKSPEYSEIGAVSLESPV